jgi:hypothetical protein
MKKSILSALLILLYQLSFSQIDTELIKKNVTENPQENFYSHLEIFKSSPTILNQEQLNQLYYGSKFVQLDYSIWNYNSENGTFWKAAQKEISKGKAEKMKSEAERKYFQNPLNIDLLDNMINIYSVLNESQKLDLCSKQKNLLINTIEKSGDGKSEETAVCVIAPDDVLRYLKKIIQSPRDELSQKMKQLPDGSILTIYKIGERQMAVKLVGGYFLP